MIFDDVTAVMSGLICEAFLYGCYTILFVVSVYLTFKRSSDQNGINKHIFIISIFLYLICTVHFALELVHFYTVVKNGGMEVSRDEVALLTAADVLVAIADFIGQLILIYRCWLLWSKNFLVIILPTLTAITSLLCVSVALHSVVLIHPMTNLTPPLIRLSLAGFVLPLCTNVLVTTLIAARIWYISPRKMSDLLGRRVPTGPARAAIDIVVESGVLYLAVQLVFVTLLAIRHPAQAIVGPMAVQIYVRELLLPEVKTAITR
ncbi:hypothetical protein BC826DRAFT_168598 [Russula brevipes]|nr:hypothetical protein BC826DRAFT_168598 [Russula brevipes]